MKEPHNPQNKSASYDEAHEDSVEHNINEEIVEPNIPVSNFYDKLSDATCDAKLGKVPEPGLTSKVTESLKFVEEQMKRISKKMDKNLEMSQKIAHKN